jgi:hypothetical protein
MYNTLFDRARRDITCWSVFRVLHDGRSVKQTISSPDSIGDKALGIPIEGSVDSHCVSVRSRVSLSRRPFQRPASRGRTQVEASPRTLENVC